MKKKYINITALIRYKIIDTCLSDPNKNYTIQELNNLCLNELQKYDYLNAKVSNRTIEFDISNLKKRYKAPIIVVNRKYYTYSNPNFIIKKLLIALNPVYIKKFKKNQFFYHIFKEYKAFKKIIDQKIIILNYSQKHLNLDILIRLNIIDNCLRDTTNNYTINDIKKRCEEEDYTKDKISYNSIKKYINILKGDKYDYNAPIVLKNSFYSYSKKNFTIKNLPIPLNNIFINDIKKTINFIEIFKNFDYIDL